jgi:hypothetical protein
VSAEQIARAKEWDIEEYILTHEPNNVRRVGRAYYLRDHNSLEISNGLWHWHSQGVGGKNCIDYLIKVRGYGFVDAVRHLAGEDYGLSLSPAPKARPPTVSESERERAAFRLPPHNADNDRVIAYLQSRGIARDIIEDCVNRGSLYETADWHNCCFVGRDDSGKARYAALRGTLGDFKRDADGSDKRFGFSIPPGESHKHVAMIFESPIDALSEMTFAREFGGADGWRLSLGGTSLTALTQFLGRHPEITHCMVCTDNDAAGDKVWEQIIEKTKLIAIRHSPVGKDWNETLQTIRNEVNPLEDARKDILFLEEPFKYPEAFRIKDGDSVKVTYAFDGEVAILKCRFIDEVHLYIGNNAYHISELAEKLKKNGNRVEPLPGRKPVLDVIAAKYGEPLQDAEIPMTETALQKLVGGKYKVEPLMNDAWDPPRPTDCAKISGKNGVAICGLGGKDKDVLTSLHPYWAQKYKRELGVIEKPSLLGNLETKKAIAAEQKANAETARTGQKIGLEVG